MRYLQTLLSFAVLNGLILASGLFAKDGINQSIKLEIKRSIQKGVELVGPRAKCVQRSMGASGIPA